ncbi:Protein CBG26051 [Caenorhabditis briggsae]|uniref:Protein CBG26051 n=1 Tax=Caenorhabditis briggsae TaxID=6238 RepID=B6IEE5_CAEBR|nr:Protein CBG26051 [Caenorhabditis briggsae]CAR98275.1 Protein CBG26051 [Caenorhabditis briggsae]
MEILESFNENLKSKIGKITMKVSNFRISGFSGK